MFFRAWKRAANFVLKLGPVVPGSAVASAASAFRCCFGGPVFRGVLVFLWVFMFPPSSLRLPPCGRRLSGLECTRVKMK